MEIKNYEEDIMEWKVDIYGPKESPYSGGIFNFIIKFPKDYPFQPFKVILNTKIYHPNFSKWENACCPLGLCDRWSPVLSFGKIAIKIVELFENPNFDTECVKMSEYKDMTFDEKFKNKAKEHTLYYAYWDCDKED